MAIEPSQQKPAEGVHALLLIAAIAATIWNFFAIRDLQKKEAEHDFIEWQENTLFNLVVQAGNEGGTFANLYNRYKEAETTDPRPPHELTKATFHQGVIGLIGKRVILPLGTDRYRLLADSDLAGGGHCGFEVVNHLVPKALDELSKEKNGTMNYEQLVDHFVHVFTIKQGESHLLLNFMFGNKLFGMERTTQKIWNLSARRDKLATCETGVLPMPKPMPIPDPQFQPASGYDSEYGEAVPRVSPSSTPPPGREYQRVPRRRPPAVTPSLSPATPVPGA